ncbi:hypothetical protein [Nocardiopsis ansamitocini]|uniref:Uncharacterized protein n=1 Tax=Nocardiopsis ansamitocini TaxID=1670832 RepID=A0A9W6P5J8_9ACTN|nr:hypothetical protein [Nocardiopsis ansamitocini]GLU47815.1 hypothetical protein Nans01_21660 [Nocardiopsis ansamitocini]
MSAFAPANKAIPAPIGPARPAARDAVAAAHRRAWFTERHKLPVGNPRPHGTNGYTTSWGTNAHGELSACPPGPA